MDRTLRASAGTSLHELVARNGDKAALALVAFTLLVRTSTSLALVILGAALFGLLVATGEIGWG